MILIVFAIVLICGFIIADAIIDYIFVCVYALAAMAITNNVIHAIRYYKKYGTVDSGDVKASILYFMMAVATIIFHCMFF